MYKRDGSALAVAATAIAISIADRVSADEANVLAAFFTVIGDQLALIAATEVSGDDPAKG